MRVFPPSLATPFILRRYWSRYCAPQRATRHAHLREHGIAVRRAQEAFTFAVEPVIVAAAKKAVSRLRVFPVFCLSALRIRSYDCSAV